MKMSLYTSMVGCFYLGLMGLPLSCGDGAVERPREVLKDPEGKKSEQPDPEVEQDPLKPPLTEEPQGGAGLKILPPEQGIYLGAYDFKGGVEAFEQAAGQKVAILGFTASIRDVGFSECLLCGIFCRRQFR